MTTLSKALRGSLLAVLLISPLLLACDDGHAPATEATAEPQGGDAPAPNVEGNSSDGGAGSPDFAPLSSQGVEVAGTPGASAATAAGIVFDMPEGWEKQPLSSSMRVAQAGIPGPGGEGLLAVFFFGPGQGGGVEANIQRWIGQMGADAAEPERGTFETNGLRVTWIELKGTLKAGQFGMGPATDQPGSRLLGAVVEGSGGPWFFKVTGPDETLAPQRDAFFEMLESVRLGQSV